MTRRRAGGGAGIVSTQTERRAGRAQVPAVDEALRPEIEHEHAVAAGGGQKDAPAGHADFVTVLQIGIGERLEHVKILIENEQLRIRRDQYAFTVKRDASQATVAAASADVDSRVVPIEFQLGRAAVEIDPVEPAVALAQA